jgi:hypothetical protein
VYVTGSMRLPLWLAIGRELPDVRQWTLSLDQHGQEWQTRPLVREVGRLLSTEGRHPRKCPVAVAPDNDRDATGAPAWG